MNAAAHGALHVRRVIDLAARIEQVPLLPSVVTRLLALDPKAERYFEDLVRLARQDPTFALRIVRMANSSASAPRTPIVELAQAVVRIGARQCVNLITALAVSRVFVPHTLAQRRLWLHSIQVAVIARTIAATCVGAPFTAEQAYLAGLLHDIGRFVMFECAAADLDTVDEARWTTPDELLAAEARLLGYDHVRLGVLVCGHWGLPASLIDVVAQHHASTAPAPAPAPARAPAPAPATRTHRDTCALVQCIRMADRVSVRVTAEPEWLCVEPGHLAEQLALECARTDGSAPPVAPSALAQRIPAAFREAAIVASGLLELAGAVP